jgi:hypothetical protein
MARIRILDPVAAPPEVDPDPGPDAGTLAGKLVGLRYDSAWRSFDWVLDEWKPMLEGAGASLRWWEAGNRVGEGGEQTFAGLAEFAKAVDVGIVGLGN